MSHGATPTIRHNERARRFEAEVEGRVARLDYDRDGDVLHIYHTEVPRALEGRGIAAAMVRTAIAYADAHSLRIHPACSYVRTYMRRHPDTHRLLPEGVSP